MHAYLIISPSQELGYQKALEIAQKKGSTITRFDIEKIDDTRTLSKIATLNLPKTSFFSNIENATVEAMNAFLKTLEEAEDNVTFILFSKNEWAIPQTIASRCQIIRIPAYKTNSDQNIKEFLKLNEFARLEMLSQIKDRKEAISYLTKIIYELNLLLIKSPNKKIANALACAETTRQRISQNANVTLQLANFALSL
jgi:DNA polymerase III delta prime subunit